MLCLYVGNQTAYGTYQKYVFEKQLADEQAMTANDMPMTWDGVPGVAGRTAGTNP